MRAEDRERLRQELVEQEQRFARSRLKLIDVVEQYDIVDPLFQRLAVLEGSDGDARLELAQEVVAEYPQLGRHIAAETKVREVRGRLLEEARAVVEKEEPIRRVRPGRAVVRWVDVKAEFLKELVRLEELRSRLEGDALSSP